MVARRAEAVAVIACASCDCTNALLVALGILFVVGAVTIALCFFVDVVVRDWCETLAEWWRNRRRRRQ